LVNPQEKILFSGDTLFYEGIGRTDFPGASSKLLIGSINTRLFVLDDDTLVYPGHGPASSIGHEKQANPFLAVS
jgi:glyoxylase-like metal-dependent hydrolase (beta-lactamase superfamily II)